MWIARTCCLEEKACSCQKRCGLKGSGNASPANISARPSGASQFGFQPNAGPVIPTVNDNGVKMPATNTSSDLKDQTTRQSGSYRAYGGKEFHDDEGSNNGSPRCMFRCQQ